MILIYLKNLIEICIGIKRNGLEPGYAVKDLASQASAEHWAGWPSAEDWAWRWRKNRNTGLVCATKESEHWLSVGGLASTEESEEYWSASAALRLQKNRKSSGRPLAAWRLRKESEDWSASTEESNEWS